MPPSQALVIAMEKELDLVEIAPTATPPVCRIMNSGKFFYQQSKRESESRKHQKHIHIKEIKFRPKIDEHDYQFKKRNAERFLKEGDKVKATMIFRGRENAHTDVGRRILERLAGEITDVGEVEMMPRQEGNTLTLILAPRKDLRVPEKPVKKKQGREDAQPESAAQSEA
jgi:translation initiation factor IF-3